MEKHTQLQRRSLGVPLHRWGAIGAMDGKPYADGRGLALSVEVGGGIAGIGSVDSHVHEGIDDSAIRLSSFGRKSSSASRGIRYMAKDPATSVSCSVAIGVDRERL